MENLENDRQIFQDTLFETEDCSNVKTPEEYAQFFQDILHKNENYQEVTLKIFESLAKDKDNIDNSILISLPKTAYRTSVGYMVLAWVKTKGSGYLRFKIKYRNWFEQHNINTTQINSMTDFFRIPLEEFPKIEQLKDDPDFIQLIEDIFLDALTFEPFGCCHKYVECSDAKKCLHDDLIYATACMYRKNLEQGRIFYGKNRNIDGSSINNQNVVIPDFTFKIEIGGGKHSPVVRDKKGSSIVDFPNEYCVIDIETTGFDPRYDEIIEIASLKIVDGKIVDTFQSLVKPEIPVDSYITELTGIDNDMLKNAPVIENIISDFYKFIGDCILVGHNVNFDINFLYDIQELTNDFIDTMRISRKLHTTLKHHRLKDIVAFYNIDAKTFHRSLADCQATFECYKKMTENILREYETLEDFKKMFKVIKNKYGISGKYKNQQSFDDLIEKINTDEESDLFQKVCVFTGTLDKMSRSTAMAIVERLGGICGKGVTSKTNYLILGNNDYCKTIKDGKSSKHKKAEQLKLKGYDIEIISENVFYDMIFESND